MYLWAWAVLCSVCYKTIFLSWTSPSVCRLSPRIRAQSPSNAHQYHYSPTRQRPNASDNRKAENDKVGKKGEHTKAETAAKKSADINSLISSPPAQKNMASTEIAKTKSSDKYLKGDTIEKCQSPERGNQLTSKGDPLEKMTQSNFQDGDKKKGGFYKFLFFPFTFSFITYGRVLLHICLCDRSSTMHRQGGCWHIKCRGG